MKICAHPDAVPPVGEPAPTAVPLLDGQSLTRMYVGTRPFIGRMFGQDKIECISCRSMLLVVWLVLSG